MPSTPKFYLKNSLIILEWKGWSFYYRVEEKQLSAHRNFRVIEINRCKEKEYNHFKLPIFLTVVLIFFPALSLSINITCFLFIESLNLTVIFNHAWVQMFPSPRHPCSQCPLPHCLLQANLSSFVRSIILRRVGVGGTWIMLLFPYKG